MLASNISAEHFVGLAGGGYLVGMAIGAAYEWSAIFCLLPLILVFLSFYLKNRIFTVPEFLERRFDCRRAAAPVLDHGRVLHPDQDLDLALGVGPRLQDAVRLGPDARHLDRGRDHRPLHHEGRTDHGRLHGRHPDRRPAFGRLRPDHPRPARSRRHRRAPRQGAGRAVQGLQAGLRSQHPLDRGHFRGDMPRRGVLLVHGPGPRPAGVRGQEPERRPQGRDLRRRPEAPDPLRARRAGHDRPGALAQPAPGRSGLSEIAGRGHAPRPARA